MDLLQRTLSALLLVCSALVVAEAARFYSWPFDCPSGRYPDKATSDCKKCPELHRCRDDRVVRQECQKPEVMAACSFYPSFTEKPTTQAPATAEAAALSSSAVTLLVTLVERASSSSLLQPPLSAAPDIRARLDSIEVRVNLTLGFVAFIAIAILAALAIAVALWYRRGCNAPSLPVTSTAAKAANSGGSGGGGGSGSVKSVVGSSNSVFFAAVAPRQRKVSSSSRLPGSESEILIRQDVSAAIVNVDEEVDPAEKKADSAVPSGSPSDLETSV